MEEMSLLLDVSMRRRSHIITGIAGITALSLLTACGGGQSSVLQAPGAAAASNSRSTQSANSTIRHVLLLSIDGMHAVDLQRFVSSHPQSALASLTSSGVTYTNAHAPYPSDSFPGLLALVTGGHPRSTGVYYDDSFDRALYPPGSNCTSTTGPGTEVVYDESIDRNDTVLDGGGSIDATKLPLAKNGGACTAVYPHSFLRVNTIFEVIKAAGGRTAWTDKHLSYELVNGPSGTGVDDLYTPEIAANGDYTKHFDTIRTYDDLKVLATLKQIDGYDHTGTHVVGTPAIFGMNFQAVSVGQKLLGGGYLDASATPTANLEAELEHTDASIGKMLAELTAKGLRDSTLVIVTAKHGQSPIDPQLRAAVDDGPYGTALAGNLGNGRYQTDDVALIWLQDQRAANVNSALANLRPVAATLHFDQGTVYGPSSLPAGFGSPSDGRTPDIAVEPNHGTIYTSGTKRAEHGGFADDDTHVALLISFPSQQPHVASQAVETTQVAPTILRALGIERTRLQAVSAEGTPDLPELNIFNSVAH